MTVDRVFLLKAMLLSSVGSSLFLSVYAAAVAPSGVGQVTGLRGLKRRRALEQIESWRSIEPVVRWLGMRLSGIMSSELKEELDRKISIAGDFMGLLPEELVGLSLVTAFGALLVGELAGWLSGMGNVLVIGCAFFGGAAPYLTITSTGDERLKEMSRRLPYGVDLLALGMGAGLDFPGAVRQVIEKSGRPNDPLVEEFTLILQSLQIGSTRRQALEDFAARVPSDAVKEFVAAVVQAELRGNPVANVLRIQAEVSRQRRSVRAEESASKAAVQMVGPLMLVFIAILLLIVSPMVLTVSASGM
jgi:tight adherence protein C